MSVADVAAGRGKAAPNDFGVQLLAGDGDCSPATKSTKRFRSSSRRATMFPEYGGDDSPYALLATAYEKKGDKRKQADVLAKWTTLTETNAKALIKLADLLQALGDARGAADALDRAMFVNPFDVDDASAARRSGAARPATSSTVVRERAAIVALGPVDRAEALLSARARAARGRRRRARAQERAARARGSAELREGADVAAARSTSARARQRSEEKP